MSNKPTQLIPIGPVGHSVRVTEPVRSAQVISQHAPVTQPTTSGGVASQTAPGTTQPEPPQSAPVDISQAIAALQNQTLSILDTIAQAVADTEQRRQISLDEMQLVAVELAVAIASRVIGETMETHESRIVPLIEQALGTFRADEQLTILINPADLKHLQTAVDGKPPPWMERDGLSIKTDSAIACGDCEIKGADFNYVARLELILDEMRVVLMESLENAQIERRRSQAADTGLRRFPDRRETA